jgi:hypothetical protein
LQSLHTGCTKRKLVIAGDVVKGPGGFMAKQQLSFTFNLPLVLQTRHKSPSESTMVVQATW